MYDRSAHPEQTRMYNEHHKGDIHYAIQQCQWFMRGIGIPHFKYGSPSHNERLISLLVIFISFFIMGVVIIPAGSFILFSDADLEVKIKLAGPLGFCFTAATKYCYLGINGATFGKCVQHIGDDWKNVVDHDHRSIMLKNALVGRRLIKFCAIFFYAGGVTYHTVLPFTFREKINETLTIRPLIYPGYDGFLDTQASPTNEILYVLQAMCAFIACSVTVATCSLTAIYMTHACGQVQVLMALLNDLIDGKKCRNTTMENRLSVIAKHHVRVLGFIANVEGILHGICLFELLTSIYNLCMIQYYFIMEWENNDVVAVVTYVSLWISFAFNILILCYIAELLMEQYNKIGTATYSINWYDLTGNKATDLIMIIMISQFPPKITAGKFVDLNINTFGNVLKTSAVYFNLLRTVIK